MAVFKCKMCGGDLEINATDVVIECEYCGTHQTVPGSDNEKKLNLFNRANRLRINGEFDKAAGIYESIVAEFPEEAEAYWGLVICNLGIEYVDDPLTGKKIPTCHRASFEPVQNDDNYKMALEYADVVAQKVYRDEAREIDRIREEILALSKNEKPYDIFICYKETASDGERTVDSVIAQDVYDILIEKGYRVFFSRVTLEDKIGRQYEPYIFAALNSAKVMLAFGTKYEYYHAVWVKNEWSRFLKLMAKDKTKVLVPCYKDMDPYDLPDEFRALQAQDMGKVGATQDLLRGIEKIISAKIVEKSKPKSASSETTPLLERAMLFIEAENFASADKYAERVLDIDPQNAKAYLVKLLCNLKLKSEEELKNSLTDYSEDTNYRMLIRFADEVQKAKLSEYCKQNVENIKNKYIDEKYANAYNLALEANAVKSAEIYEKAADVFAELGDYKDSVECEKKYRELAHLTKKSTEYQAAKDIFIRDTISDLKRAKNLFFNLGDYEDSAEYVIKCGERLNELEEAQRINEKIHKRNVIIAAITITALIIGLITTLALVKAKNEKEIKAKYNQAQELFSNAKYREAYELFLELGVYEDSADMADKLKTIVNIEKLEINGTLYKGSFITTVYDYPDYEVSESNLSWKLVEKKSDTVYVFECYQKVVNQKGNSFSEYFKQHAFDEEFGQLITDISLGEKKKEGNSTYQDGLQITIDTSKCK